MFTTYVIKSKTTEKIYIGQTSNLENRLKRHNGSLTSKNTSYTKRNRGPWEVIYTETFPTRKEAVKREKELKSAKGREFIKNLLGLPSKFDN